LGPNGAGKTTTFYMTTGFIAPDAGQVFFEEDGASQDITRMPMYKRARLGIGYLPQEASIFRKLTVEENLMAILELTPLSPPERQKRLKNLLGEFNVAHLAKQKAYTLSGGERRRVEIARALTTDPAFIRGHRPHRRAGYSGHHPAIEEEENRDPHHRPQCPRNPLDRGPGLYYVRGKNTPVGHRR
jgi:ABC-type lipopolysaccharide export system ATPase subunit